jgi:hypothetical protein
METHSQSSCGILPHRDAASSRVYMGAYVQTNSSEQVSCVVGRQSAGKRRFVKG